MRRPPTSLVWMTVFAIAVAAVLATAPRVAAAQNAPAWTQGDFWVYARTAGSATSTVGVSFSLNIAYSGTVLREQSTSVAAGTFNVAVIRNPSTGTAHSEDQYSDGAGNYVKRESYDGSGNRVADQELTSFRYQSGFFGLLLIIGSVVVIAAVAIALFIVVRRRRRGSMLPPPGTGPPPTPPPP